MARKRKKSDRLGENLPVTPLSSFNIDPQRARDFTKPAAGPSGAVRVAGAQVVGAGGVNTSTVVVNGNQVTPTGATVIPDPSKPMAAENYLTKAEIERNKKLLESPPDTTKEQDQSWFDTLLDTTNTWKPVLDENGKPTGREEFQGVDSVGGLIGGIWDSGLRALQWGTDRLTQASVAAMSAMPGGTRTWSWDEAGNVSFGQQMLADAAATQGRVTRGEATASDYLARAFGGVASIGASIAANNDPDTILQRGDFDLQDEQQRQEAFSQGWERTFSGAADFGFAFADPTLFVGWGTKIAKLRYVDRIITDEKSLSRAVEEINYGGKVLDRNKALLDSGEIGADSLAISGASRFLYEVTRKNADGTKAIPLDQLMNHRVIKRAANRDALGAALHSADNYAEASLIMRHAWGDSTASRDLLRMRPDAFVEIIDGERQIVSMMIAANPSKQAKLIEKYQLKMDQYDAELDWLRKNMGDDPDLAQKIDFVRTKKNETAEKWLAASKGQQPALGAASKPSADEIAAVKARVDFLKAKDSTLTRALDEARNGAPTGLYGSLRGSTAGFASSTRVGRMVESSRWRRAESQYQSEMLRGTHFWQADEFFGTSRGRRALRVWRYLGQETPSGVVHLAGIGAQESTREVRAMLNSVRIYSGKGKQVGVKADGTPEMVGGIAKKEDLLTRYQNAALKGSVEGRNEMSQVLREIEETIEADLVKWYGFNGEHMAQIMNKVNSTRQKLKDDILNRGFWVDDDGTENAIPFLETQLHGSEITADWRRIESAIRDSTKEARGGARGTARAGYDMGKGWSVTAYENFQDLWRPAVLLRLGYTQRNVAEGLFRSMAFQFSLAPALLATKQLGLSGGNLARTAAVGRTGSRGVTEKAMAAARKGEKGPKRFEKWVGNQKAQHADNMRQNRDVITMARTALAEESETWRLAEIGRLDWRVNDLAQKNADLMATMPTGNSKSDLALKARIGRAVASNKAWQAELSLRAKELRKIRGGQAGDLSPELSVIEDNLRYFEDVIEPSLRAQGQVLDDPLSAAIMYREQTLARRRVYSGQSDFSDPKSVQSTFLSMMEGDAFNPSDPYSAIALANLSADNTMKQAAALRMTTAQTVFQKKVTQHYKAIDPDKNPEEYFDGLATMLNQFKQSEVGKIVVQGLAGNKLSDDDIAAQIAAFIRTTPEGREIGLFVTESSQTAARSKWVPYNEAQRAAERAAEKATAALRTAADNAVAGVSKAQQEVADAQARLAAAQAKNPRLRALYDSQGKRITDPVKYVERAEAAAKKAEDAWQAAYDKVVKDKTKGLEGRFEVPVLSIEDALSYGATMVKRYRQLTADSPQLHQYLASNSLDVGPRSGKKAGDTLREFIGPGATRPDGSAYVLRPVIGNIVQETGHPSMMDAVRKASNFGFKWLGTVPEDNFVRAPFYGRRYEKVYRELEESMLAQNPEGLTVKQVNQLRDAAHRRSLKDTKDWLYTIDRRTMLGDYGEKVFPFISATQNSVTTVGRLIWNDPRVLWAMTMVWQAPQKAGIEDEEGNIVIPVAWLPEAVKNVLPLDSMENMVIRKGGLNVVLPENGFGMIPTPGPVAVVPVSTMMQQGFLIDVVPPEPLVAVLGQETADSFWEDFKSYVYGSSDDTIGASSQPLSWDKAMPPILQKAIQMWQGEGGSSAYTTWYNRIYQTEMLKWGAGMREEMPTPEEISSQTKAFYGLRMAGNLLAFTPPGYESKMQPIVDSIQRIYDTTEDRDKAAQLAYEQFGPLVMQMSKITSTASVGGLPATTEALRFAERNEQLISTVAPVLESNGTLDVLGVLAPSSSEAEYDPSVSARQQVMEIAGTDRKWREVRDPRQAWVESQKSAGWAQYLKNMDLLNALLAQRGLKSLQSKGAEDLLEAKNQTVENMRNDPRYSAWYADYKNFASSRTTDTVAVIETALSSASFREANEDSPVWGPGGYAEQYITYRDQVLAAARASGSSLSSKANQGLLADWLAFRGDLAARSPEWAAKQERYLDADENPEETQVISVTMDDLYTPTESVSPNAPDYLQPGTQEGMTYGG